MSGRKVELDEVVEPSLELERSLELESGAAPEDVPAGPAPTSDEADDGDHQTSNEAPAEPRR